MALPCAAGSSWIVEIQQCSIQKPMIINVLRVNLLLYVNVWRDISDTFFGSPQTPYVKRSPTRSQVEMSANNRSGPISWRWFPGFTGFARSVPAGRRGRGGAGGCRKRDKLMDGIIFRNIFTATSPAGPLPPPPAGVDRGAMSENPEPRFCDTRTRLKFSEGGGGIFDVAPNYFGLIHL